MKTIPVKQKIQVLTPFTQPALFFLLSLTVCLFPLLPVSAQPSGGPYGPIQQTPYR